VTNEGHDEEKGRGGGSIDESVKLVRMKEVERISLKLFFSSGFNLIKYKILLSTLERFNFHTGDQARLNYLLDR